MKYTEAIEEMQDLISEYENDIHNGYIGDNVLTGQVKEYMEEAIVNMACAIEVLKNNET